MGLVIAVVEVAEVAVVAMVAMVAVVTVAAGVAVAMVAGVAAGVVVEGRKKPEREKSHKAPLEVCTNTNINVGRCLLSNMHHTLHPLTSKQVPLWWWLNKATAGRHPVEPSTLIDESEELEKMPSMYIWKKNTSVWHPVLCPPKRCC
jgi:hypothetical protein